MPLSGTLAKAHIIDAVAERDGFTRQKSESADCILIPIINCSS